MKKIVFDARMYGLEHAGIGRYVLSLLINFQFPISNFQITLLVRDNKLEEIKQDLGNQFEYVPVKSKHYSFFEQLEIPWVLCKINPDLVHFPHFNAPVLWRKNFVVTIHDLIKHYFTGKETTTRRGWLYWLKNFGYRIQVNHALNNSALIFVPSIYWQNRLSEDFEIEKNKILVTPEAVDPAYLKKTKFKNSRKKLTHYNGQPKYKLEKPYLIYTGSVYPHKNINLVFEALKKLPKMQLGIACSRNVFTKRVEDQADQLGLGNQVKFLGFVPDDQLINLYHQALCLVQPSLMEGFGLTGLEAMAAGCPVIAANATCLPEVYGQGAMYFDPHDAKSLVKVINDLYENPSLRSKLIVKGRKQVKKYSWQETANLTLEGYMKVLKKL